MTVTLRLDQVSKKYRIGNALPTVRSVFSNWRNRAEEQAHWAVKDVSFELQPGQALGVIGPNGAGKTTLLKLLSRVTSPTSGQVQLNGRFSALIELGAGFHPELTGRENIYLNGTILGMRRREITARFDQIVEFAGIGKYLDTPIKRYSSGMYARLGFAVAAHVDPEILLIDEVLAVGDMAFQKRCYERMRQLIEGGTTMVFVSHNMRAIQEVCPRCLIMYRGHKVFDGPTAEATAEYSNILRQAASERHDLEVVEDGIAQRTMTHGAIIEKVQMLRADGQPALTFNAGETVRVKVTVRFNVHARAPIVACRIQHPSGQVVYDFTTHWAGQPTPDFQANSRAELEFVLQANLVGGTYHLGLNLAYEDLTRYYDRLDRALDFVVIGRDGARGIANLAATFNVHASEPLEHPAPVTRELNRSAS